MSDKIERIKELTALLNEASRRYYSEGDSIMPDVKYDALYDELVALENETGVVMAKSPTQRVGYEVLSSLPKVQHASPMLSLDKTKSVESLKDFTGEQKCVLSWKLDGLTVVLTYENGKLAKAVTRGNGEVGEVITNNAKTFVNLPLSIPFKGRLVLRGEAVISYEDFEKINETMEDDLKFKNPRNLCSGAVRQLNSEITAARQVNWNAFSLVEAEGLDFDNSIEKQFIWLKEQGFSVVEYKIVDRETIEEAVKYFAKAIETNKYPSDGLVIVYDDIEYGKSLGRTAKFPRNSIAFKWADDMAETELLEIEWSPSRTGLINPVAIFKPVELEGTTVSRASLHNISVMRDLKLGIGDRLKVYKANMIIPQVAENLTKSDYFEIPSTCPVCGGRTHVSENNEVAVLYCTNPDCSVKKVKAFSLFVSRNALNIEGLSDATLEKFLENHIVDELYDLFHLENHKEEIVNMEGFGEKSYTNFVNNIEAARHTELHRIIYGLGIPGIGVANAKVLAKYFDYNIESLCNASVEELASINGMGDIMAKAVCDYFNDEKNMKILDLLLKELTWDKPTAYDVKTSLDGKVFVITGSLNTFSNRNELKDEIEKAGGKVTGSVTKNTDYLINNDILSGSSKNKKAKELNVPIITEEQIIEMLK